MAYWKLTRSRRLRLVEAEHLDRGASGRLLQETDDLLVGIALLHGPSSGRDGLYLDRTGHENGGQVSP
jgi:hypothetical protein